MKRRLLEFRIHGDGSAEFVEAQLDWDLFSTQLECIYHLQGEERRNPFLMRNNLVKYRKIPQRWAKRNGMITLNYSAHTHGGALGAMVRRAAPLTLKDAIPGVW
jgi:hypothetical protein